MRDWQEERDRWTFSEDLPPMADDDEAWTYTGRYVEVTEFPVWDWDAWIETEFPEA